MDDVGIHILKMVKLW